MHQAPPFFCSPFLADIPLIPVGGTHREKINAQNNKNNYRQYLVIVFLSSLLFLMI